jgi:hypothetical protein
MDGLSAVYIENVKPFDPKAAPHSIRERERQEAPISCIFTFLGSDKQHFILRFLTPPQGRYDFLDLRK